MGLKQAKKIVIDLGLVIECKEEELLPERLLCAWRMCRPDLTQTVNIDWRVCWKKKLIRSLEKPRGRRQLVLQCHTPKKRQPPAPHWP